MADAFVDMIGVNVHAFYASNNPENAYGKDWKTLLKSTGIRHVRDVIASGTNLSAQMSKAADLWYRENNIKPLYSIFGPAAGYGDQLGALVGSNDWLPEAVESYNEWDHSTLTSDYVGDIRSFQPQLYSAIKNRWPNCVVLTPPLATRTNGSQVGDLSAHADALNTHVYGSAASTIEHTPTLYEHARFDADVIAMAPAKPNWMTESGLSSGSDTAAYTTLLSSGRLIPRFALRAFRLGYSRWYAYELLDQFDPIYHISNPSEDRYGLYDYNLNPKPGGRALSNIIAILSDPGPSFTPGSLTWTAEGNTTYLETELFQKRDGSFWLAYWQSLQVVTHPGSGGTPQLSGTDIDELNMPVTFTFDRTCGSLSYYRSMYQERPIKYDAAKRKIVVNSTHDVQFIRISGSVQSGVSVTPLRRYFDTRPWSLG